MSSGAAPRIERTEPSPAPGPSPDPGRRPRLPAPDHGWQWLTARVALALFVATLLGSLWMIHRSELEEDRNSLIRDALWVEQNIQFGLERDLEQLRDVAADAHGLAMDQHQLEERTRHLFPNSAGLLRVVLLDNGGTLVASAPGASETPPDVSFIDAESEPDYRLARSLGRPVYGPARLVAGEGQVEVFVPAYANGVRAGTVVGLYGLKAMLAGLVPWWLAEKHRVTIRDALGNVLAAKSNIEAEGRPELTHQAPLDPPGHGLVLHLESYGAQTQVIRNLLAVVIIGLAGTVAWSVWSLRRHIQWRHDTERELEEEHAFRKAMEDSLVTGMRAVDLEGRIIYVNPAFCRIVGYEAHELIGRAPPQPYWPGEEQWRITEVLRAAREPGAPRAGIELELVRRDGERFDALLYESPLIDASGKQAGWMGSILDITERKRAREQVRLQEEKLASTARLVTMGEMASAIAHELNQPLSAIASYITGCLNFLHDGQVGEIAPGLEKAVQQAQRAGLIIRRVHAFVRKSEPTVTRVHINSVVEEAVAFAEAEARKRRMHLTSRLCEANPELDADPLLLQQVLLNLLRNAMDAMADTPQGRREIVVTSEVAGATVVVGVADHGCGLSPDVQGQLFSAFFSTKKDGMGMGLNICRSILELHRGRVWAEPAPEGGTVFYFSLPLEAT